jgi:formate-dependent nitrite reductase membrane component NrfD
MRERIKVIIPFMMIILALIGIIITLLVDISSEKQMEIFLQAIATSTILLICFIIIRFSD